MRLYALVAACALVICQVSTVLAGRDYYEILGVPRDASDRVLKKEFRRLAKAYHPDKAKGNEKKFQEISTAYEVLSNPEKRQVYDNFGEEGLKNGGGGGGGGGGFHGFDMGGMGGMGGGGFRMEFDGSSFEQMFNMGGFGNFGGFESSGGGGGGGGGFGRGGGRRRQRTNQRQERQPICEQMKVCEEARCHIVQECHT